MANRPTMDILQAKDLTANYVCARCWGPLVALDQHGELVVSCVNPNCDGEGYVRRQFAERRKQASVSEYLEAARNLPALSPHHQKSEQDLLKELGY